MVSILRLALPAAVFAFFAPAISIAAPGGSSSPGGAAAGTSSAGAASSAPSGSGGAASVPSGAIIHTRKPTVYILAASFDPSTATAVTMEAAIRLNPALSTALFTSLDKQFPGYTEAVCSKVGAVCLLPPNDKPTSGQPVHHIWLLPEPAWQLSDFISQCQTDPQDTIGAIIIGSVENDSGNFNYLVWSDGYTDLFADAAFLTCEARGTTEFVSPLFTTNPKPTMLPFPKSPSSSQQVETVQTQEVVTHPATTPAASLQLQTVVTRSPKPSANPQQARTVTWTTITPARISSKKDQLGKDVVPNTTVSIRTSTIAQTRMYSAMPRPTPTPAMNMIWDAGSSLTGYAHQGGIPLYALVGAGTYLASRTKTTAQNAPGNCNGIVAPSPVPKGLSCLTTTTSPSIPIGYALLGSVLAGTSGNTVTVGGTSGPRLLKNAAAALANQLAGRLHDDCEASTKGTSMNDDMVWLCSEIFDTNKLRQ